ncbi:hypothetical protein D3C81_1087680 [compost metagenome]
MPLMPLPEAIDKELLASTSPVTSRPDAFKSIVGDFRLPVTWLPEPMVSEVVAVISPWMRVLAARILTTVPLIGPLMTEPEAISTGPLALILPVTVTLFEPILMLVAKIFAVMVCSCAPRKKVPPSAVKLPPVTFRFGGLISLISRLPLTVSAALPLIVKPWL